MISLETDGRTRRSNQPRSWVPTTMTSTRCSSAARSTASAGSPSWPMAWASPSPDSSATAGRGPRRSARCRRSRLGASAPCGTPTPRRRAASVRGAPSGPVPRDRRQVDDVGHVHGEVLGIVTEQAVRRLGGLDGALGVVDGYEDSCHGAECSSSATSRTTRNTISARRATPPTGHAAPGRAAVDTRGVACADRARLVRCLVPGACPLVGDGRRASLSTSRHWAPVGDVARTRRDRLSTRRMAASNAALRPLRVRRERESGARAMSWPPRHNAATPYGANERIVRKRSEHGDGLTGDGGAERGDVGDDRDVGRAGGRVVGKYVAPATRPRTGRTSRRRG